MRPWTLQIGFILLWVLLGAPAKSDEKARTEVLVGVVASLKDVFEDLQLSFEKEQPGVRLLFHFAASGAVAQQIEQGAPYDIFISAAAKQMDALQKKNKVVKESRFNLAGNTLVLVSAPGKEKPVQLEDLKQKSFRRIAIGERATVPAGAYAEQWLKKAQLLAPLKERLVPAANVRQVLRYIASGNVDAGFVYKTDVLTLPTLTIALEAPSDAHDPIVYPVARLKRSKNPDAVDLFLRFLKSDAAGAILAKHGFSPGPKP